MPSSKANKIIFETVMKWEGVTSKPHRFGGTEYHCGSREIGHVHGDYLVDIPFPKKARDEIVHRKLAQPHHVLPNTGWVSCHLKQTDDVQKALDLLRWSYDLVKQHREK